jgi:tetratricopeptide (TPR) repeat protein
VRGSTLSIIGWGALGLLIALGVGSLLYVASGEKQGQTVPEVSNANNEPEREIKNAKTAEKNKKKSNGKKSDRDKPPKKKKDPDKSDRDGKKPPPGKSVKPTAAPVPSGVPASKPEALALLKKARGLADANNFPAAHAAYAMLKKSEHYRADALIGLARTSFELKRKGDTIKYAKAALRKKGGNKARLWLARAYHAQGNFEESLKQWNLILARDKTNREAIKNRRDAMKRLGSKK